MRHATIQITIGDLLNSSESLSGNRKHIFERPKSQSVVVGVRKGSPLKTLRPSGALWKGVAQQPLSYRVERRSR